MFRSHRMRDLFHFEAPEAGAGHPGVTQGEAPEEHDLSTDEGFTRRLAEKVGRPLGEDVEFSPSTSIQDGLSYGDEQPRDETGRFVAREAPAAPPAAQEPPPAQQEPPAAQEPPASQETTEARLERLEKELADSQAMIGRQAHEIGQYRQQVQQPQPVQQQPQGLPYMSQEEAEQVFSWVEQAGFKDAMLWSINNRPELHDVVLQAGRDMDLPEAREYEINLRVQEALMAREAQQPQQPQQADPFVERLRSQEAMKEVVTKIKGDTPDFVRLQEQVSKALEEKPILGELVASGDPQRIEQGLRLATDVARGYAATELAAAAARDASARTGEREAVKVAAQVATGSARVGTSGQTSEGTPTEEQKAEAIKEFKANIFNAPSTSVSDGLTYG